MQYDLRFKDGNRVKRTYPVNISQLENRYLQSSIYSQA
jgi:hypothetical protein